MRTTQKKYFTLYCCCRRRCRCCMVTRSFVCGGNFRFIKLYLNIYNLTKFLHSWQTFMPFLYIRSFFILWTHSTALGRLFVNVFYYYFRFIIHWSQARVSRWIVRLWNQLCGITSVFTIFHNQSFCCCFILFFSQNTWLIFYRDRKGNFW